PQIPAAAGPSYLAARLEPFRQDDFSCLDVGFAPCGITQTHQSVRFVRAQPHDPSRTMEFEAATDQQHAVCQQGRRQCIALIALEGTTVEPKTQRLAAVDAAARG